MCEPEANRVDQRGAFLRLPGDTIAEPARSYGQGVGERRCGMRQNRDDRFRAAGHA
jgi:hypothetical protein